MTTTTATTAATAAAIAGGAGQDLDLGVGAREVVGGAASQVRGALGPGGPFALAAVEAGLQVLLEAILWRGGRPGVDLVQTWIWFERT